MKILILGANSYVGARIYIELAKKYSVVGTYFSKKISDKFLYLDITQEAETREFILNQKPDTIIHVANNPYSAWCEENKEAAILLNQTSTSWIVDAANGLGAKLIYISSIAVLDGDVYGNTKLESEKIVKKTKNGYLIFRLGLVLGMSPNTGNDRTFNTLIKNLENNTKAAYNDSKKHIITYLGQLCEVTEYCLQKNIWNETVLIASEEARTRCEIAKDLLTPFGIEVEADRNGAKIPPRAGDFSRLKELSLPFYTYDQAAVKIIEEIKNKEQYRI